MPNICSVVSSRFAVEPFGLDVTSTLVLPHGPADQHVSDVLVAVQVGVAHVAGPEDQRVVEQSAVAIGVAFNFSRK